MSALEDVEAIKKLKARYFRLVDTQSWELLRGVFTVDYWIDMTDAGGGRLDGSDEFVSFLKEILNGAITVHLGYTPEIEVDSATTATGIWALHDLFVIEGTRVARYGHVYDSYVKRDDSWFIASSVITSLHMEITTAPD